jgi:dephospho-CoA kinase
MKSSACLYCSRAVSKSPYEKPLESQWPVRVKAERSDIVVINNGSAEALKKEAERVSCLLKMRYE